MSTRTLLLIAVIAIIGSAVVDAQSDSQLYAIFGSNLTLIPLNGRPLQSLGSVNDLLFDPFLVAATNGVAYFSTSTFLPIGGWVGSMNAFDLTTKTLKNSQKIGDGKRVLAYVDLVVDPSSGVLYANQIDSKSNQSTLVALDPDSFAAVPLATYSNLDHSAYVVFDPQARTLSVCPNNRIASTCRFTVVSTTNGKVVYRGNVSDIFSMFYDSSSGSIVAYRAVSSSTGSWTFSIDRLDAKGNTLSSVPLNKIGPKEQVTCLSFHQKSRSLLCHHSTNSRMDSIIAYAIDTGAATKLVDTTKAFAGQDKYSPASLFMYP